MTAGEAKILEWFKTRGWAPFEFQKQVWNQYLQGKSGIINAPTGMGKTYAAFIPVIIETLNQKLSKEKMQNMGLQLVWISPLRTLTIDIQKSMQSLCNDLDIPWEIAVRTGDSSQTQKKKQREQMPQVLITTPESLHMILSYKGYEKLLSDVKTVVVDEWHELLGSKRGVQVELGLSRIRKIQPDVRTWGLSATIGNLDQARDVLIPKKDGILIRADLDKRIQFQTIMPETIERFPWAGHLGLHMAKKVLPIIEKHKTTLIFTQTRAQTELWYRKLIELEPELVGQIALYHSSLDKKVRLFVDEAMRKQMLKVVVCTSSLDLGVDIEPVECIIQVGSPKNIARFLQRAGRSNHQPGTISTIYFLPTNSLELLDSAALRSALETHSIEFKHPLKSSYDVLVQYLMTLAVSDGFSADELFKEITATYSFENLSPDAWQWILRFITQGGEVLKNYSMFTKAVVKEGVYKVESRRAALMHRMMIGTIVGNESLQVQYLKGGKLGTVDESFISKLGKNSTFWFAGRSLKIVKIHDMTVWVRSIKAQKTGIIPRWTGTSLPLSPHLSKSLIEQIDHVSKNQYQNPELKKLEPLFTLQKRWSAIPSKNEFLVEILKGRQGTHVFFYPFQGAIIHEGLATLIAFRLAQLMPITFSISMNDYGFELLSKSEWEVSEKSIQELFSPQSLDHDLQQALNTTELQKRKFREIGKIAGIFFGGFPGRKTSARHLQSNSDLMYDVFQKYEPDNLLLKQANNEVVEGQLEKSRIESICNIIQEQNILIKELSNPSPFSFPIIINRLRENISSESLEDRINNMQLILNSKADKK